MQTRTHPLCPFLMNPRELLWTLRPSPLLDLLEAQPNGLHFSRQGRDAVSDTSTAFDIRLDLSAFKPEEVKISVSEGRLTIAAGRDETDESRTRLSRHVAHVTHVYRLPKDVDPKTIKSTLNAEGILSIKAEKRAIKPQETEIAVEYPPE